MTRLRDTSYLVDESRTTQRNEEKTWRKEGLIDKKH
uniref:Uncharacterized protein n=1 Tax=Lepeophtheirus salmonis TaxID=72036 RepID=A0A0K2UF68_LEPSM